MKTEISLPEVIVAMIAFRRTGRPKEERAAFLAEKLDISEAKSEALVELYDLENYIYEHYND